MAEKAPTDQFAPPDQPERERIRTDLDQTLFVNAGAGSGKTATLVDRVVALVTSGTAELEHIAAITFTEKAAAELRDRVRQRLEEGALSPEPVTRRRCQGAIEQLDRAPIGTLHSFAQRILSEYPVESGLPPRVEVLDEVSSGIEFDQRWRDFSAEMLSEPSMERTLLLLLAGGIDESAARALAVAFEDNWDLVETHVPEQAAEPPDLRLRTVEIFALADELAAMAGLCRDPDDNLLKRIAEISTWIGEARRAGTEIEMLERLRQNAPSFKVGTTGRATEWGGKASIDGVRRAVQELGDTVRGVQAEVLRAAAVKLGSAIRRFTLQSAAQRQAAGRLDFHDLLVLARKLVTDPLHGPEVRVSLARRYQRLLLDEFQDTDPIQIEVAVRIAALDLDASSGDRPWTDIAVRPGALFVVGDPKQSIYRFRRADIATFLAAEKVFRAGNVTLSANFRTVSPVIEWLNGVFSHLFAIGSSVDLSVESQPEYLPLTPSRRKRPPTGPSVSCLGRSPLDTDTKADDIRAVEAQAVARTVTRILDEGWSVDDGAGGWRRASLGDIAVLVPARTSLPFLEDALEERDVAYRAESSSLVYATRPIRDLLLVLRAADDPTDELRTVAALRTPLFGCGDDDLWRYRVERNGHWDFTRPRTLSAPADDPVADGLDFLASLHRDVPWRTPSELLDGVIRERRAMELGLAWGRERDVWRRLRFVVDQARAWSEATHGNLRQYLRWVDRQAKESARSAEPILAESDHDAIRIMTIHAAKGLEFPITILSGMSTEPRRRPAAVEVAFLPTGEVGYKLGRDIKTSEFELNSPIDEQMSLDERIRLLYVAATRARDHLVVSLVRKRRAEASVRLASATSAELLVSAIGDDGRRALPEAVPPGPEQIRPPVAGFSGPAPEAPKAMTPREDWAEAMDRLRHGSRRPTTVAATALSDEGGHDQESEVPDVDPGLAKRPRDMDLPPWLKGRYGTAVGRAVHGVMQTVDLATGVGRQAAVAAQCQAEGVQGQEATVLALVEAALASPSVRQAANSPHWREVYVCVPAGGGRLLEGYIDLLYRTSTGLVIVDYKTSSNPDPVELDRRTLGYRSQGASYALAVGASTGQPVEQVDFVFLTPDGAFERTLIDVEEAITDLRLRIAEDREVVL